MADQINIVRLSEDLLPDLSQLFHKVFGIRHSVLYLQRKYDTPDLGAAYLGFLAYDQNQEPVAFCGGVPCQLAYENTKVSSLQFCDTMTLKIWRGKGLFGQLAKCLERLALDLNIEVHFALLNQDSFWAYQKKLGWEIVGEMRRYNLPVYTIPLQKLGQYFSFFQEYSNGRIQAYLSRFKQIDLMPNELESAGKLSVIHDRKFFNYKLRAGHYLLELERGQVWIKCRDGLWLGDCRLDESINPEHFIRQLKHICIQTGIHRIQIQFTKNTFLEKRMSSYITPLPSWKIGAKSYDPQIPVSDLALTLGDIDTF